MVVSGLRRFDGEKSVAGDPDVVGAAAPHGEQRGRRVLGREADRRQRPRRAVVVKHGALLADGPDVARAASPDRVQVLARWRARCSTCRRPRHDEGRRFARRPRRRPRCFPTPRDRCSCADSRRPSDWLACRRARTPARRCRRPRASTCPGPRTRAPEECRVLRWCRPARRSRSVPRRYRRRGARSWSCPRTRARSDSRAPRPAIPNRGSRCSPAWIRPHAREVGIPRPSRGLGSSIAFPSTKPVEWYGDSPSRNRTRRSCSFPIRRSRPRPFPSRPA